MNDFNDEMLTIFNKIASFCSQGETTQLLSDYKRYMIRIKEIDEQYEIDIEWARRRYERAYMNCP